MREALLSEATPGDVTSLLYDEQLFVQITSMGREIQEAVGR